ncbi:MAG TPA: hypothetical protein VE028_01175 [Nitratidesulfovibrio sp.]|nr:hypothetical protein [Nitratidesulfovibrio sp.]
MSAVSAVFTLLATMTSFAAFIGLFKPALVMRWGKPTRVKAFLVYFVLTAMLSAGIEAPPKPSPTSATSPNVASAPASAAPGSVVAALPAPVPYMLVSSEDMSSGSRKRWRYRIVPADANQSELSRQNMTATVVAAAKHYTETGGAALVQIILESQADRRPHAATQLARAEYSPDGKGAGGETGKVWSVVAGNRGLTTQEREMASMWAEMRGHYQKDGFTDEDALRAAIAKRMGISVREVTLAAVLAEPVPLSPDQLAAVPSTGPAR